MNKVYICGLVASAKGTLRALMDSHPKIVNNPFDFGASLIAKDLELTSAKQNKEKYVQELHSLAELSNIIISIKLSHKTIKLSLGNLFLHLFTTDRKYADIFDVSFSGKKGTPRLKDELDTVDYHFDCIKFFSDFIEKLLNVRNFKSIEHLQDTLYEALIMNCPSMKNQYSKDSYFLQSTYNGFEFIEKILKYNSSSKIIAVVRDPIALCYSNYQREINKLSSTNNTGVIFKLNSHYSNILYSASFIQRVKSYNDNVYKLNKSSELIHIVKTEDILENTKNTMDRIADFIGIERNKILYTPTIAGSTCGGKMLTLIEHVHDDPYKILSKTQIDLLKFYFFGHESNPLSKRMYINFERIIIALFRNKLFRILFKTIVNYSKK